MNLAVIDASAALAWQIPDEGLVEAVDRVMQAAERQEVRLIAPSLWAYEIARGLRRAAARGRVDRASAWHSLQALLATPVLLYPPRPLIERAWWIFASGRVNVYDACYLALAEGAGCQCLTADRHLLDAASSTGLVRWIGDFE